MIVAVGSNDPALADPDRAPALVAGLEAAGADLLILGEGGAPFDPLLTAAWLVPLTARIGLVAVLVPGRDHPFHAARALSALDFLSGGRAGWQVRGGAAMPDFIAAVRSLFDSWDAAALIVDPASGRYLDPALVRAGEHRGAHYRVLGPLNAARPPQGHPVLVQAADAATGADADLRIDGDRLLDSSGAVVGQHWPMPDLAAGLAGLAARRCDPPLPGQTLRHRLGLRAAPSAFVRRA